MENNILPSRLPFPYKLIWSAKRGQSPQLVSISQTSLNVTPIDYLKCSIRAKQLLSLRLFRQRTRTVEKSYLRINPLYSFEDLVDLVERQREMVRVQLLLLDRR